MHIALMWIYVMAMYRRMTAVTNFVDSGSLTAGVIEGTNNADNFEYHTVNSDVSFNGTVNANAGDDVVNLVNQLSGDTVTTNAFEGATFNLGEGDNRFTQETRLSGGDLTFSQDDMTITSTTGADHVDIDVRAQADNDSSGTASTTMDGLTVELSEGNDTAGVKLHAQGGSGEKGGNATSVLTNATVDLGAGDNALNIDLIAEGGDGIDNHNYQVNGQATVTLTDGEFTVSDGSHTHDQAHINLIAKGGDAGWHNGSYGSATRGMAGGATIQFATTTIVASQLFITAQALAGESDPLDVTSGSQAGNGDVVIVTTDSSSTPPPFPTAGQAATVTLDQVTLNGTTHDDYF